MPNYSTAFGLGRKSRSRPLMGAAAAGRADIVELMLKYGADRALFSDDGKAAADVAREHGHAELAASLTAV